MSGAAEFHVSAMGVSWPLAGLPEARSGGSGGRWRGRHKAETKMGVRKREGEGNEERGWGSGNAITVNTFWSHRFAFKSWLHYFLPLWQVIFFSEPQFAHLQNGFNNNTYLTDTLH